jgi:hypothetical protein
MHKKVTPHIEAHFQSFDDVPDRMIVRLRVRCLRSGNLIPFVGVSESGVSLENPTVHPDTFTLMIPLSLENPNEHIAN